jgi:hypothetical protein
VCQIGDDMCTVPSQLFDLPSLKGVLSLNTWNYCLTGSQFRSTHCNLVFCWLCIPHEIPSDFCAFLSLEVF